MGGQVLLPRFQHVRDPVQRRRDRSAGRVQTLRQLRRADERARHRGNTGELRGAGAVVGRRAANGLRRVGRSQAVPERDTGGNGTRRPDGGNYATHVSSKYRTRRQ